MFAGLALLLLPLAPGIGRTVSGARLWIRVGGLNFQPAEVAKVLLAAFLAGYLATKHEVLTAATVMTALPSASSAAWENKSETVANNE